MGQSLLLEWGKKGKQENSIEARLMPNVSVFSTKIGWMGLVGRENQVFRLIFGHSDSQSLWKRLTPELPLEFTEKNWFPELKTRLIAYAKGEPVEFFDVLVDQAHLTEFQQRVMSQLRSVSYGETLTYAQLAAKAGSPKAARAVGSVMANNRVPLIQPCHRVLASNGKLGGFSAPRGISFKKQLLELEATGQWVHVE